MSLAARADPVLTPDVCVIGAGAAGLSVAAGAAAFGVPVVLIEKGRMGGECLNSGCIPSKALIAAGQRMVAIRAAARFGILAGEPTIDGARLHAHIQDVIATLAPMDSQARFDALGVKVIRAAGRFTAPDRVEAGGFQIKARRFVIAAGSAPVIPAIAGLDVVRFFTTDTLFGLQQMPDHLIVLGGGVAGIELGQAYRRLGTAVTVLEAGRILSGHDEEPARIVRDRLRAEGVDIREGARVVRIDSTGGHGVRVRLRDEAREDTIEGSHLLVATGRRPIVEGLGLPAGHIAHGEAGIHVRRDLRSRSNRRVYAIGDSTDTRLGAAPSTHAIQQHAGIVLKSALFRWPAKVRPEHIPKVVFTDPEIAAIGFSEAEARQRHRRIRVMRWPFAETDRAHCERDTTGHVKLTLTPRGRILGAVIVGPQAADLIVPWALALSKRLTAADVAGLIMPYPTRSDASRRAAAAFFAPLAQKPLTRAALRFLRRFG